MEIAIVALIGLAATVVISIISSTLLYKRKAKRLRHETEDRANLIVKEAELQAENIKKDRILEAKEKLLKMKQEFEEEANRKKNQIIGNEQKIKQREHNYRKNSSR